MDFKVKRFEFGEDENNWNEFLTHSKNSTFLFDRKFMDYHKDRFMDHSLMIYDEKENLIACFPTNESKNSEISSHSGLTYGAFILDKNIKLPRVILAYKEVLKYYHEKGFNKINYKAIPRIYNSLPSDEIDYCLFLSNAKLWRRDTAIVIKQQNIIKFSGNIRREANKARNEGFTIKEATDYEDFWDNLLIPALEKRHGVKPVHDLKEIKLLANRFKDYIKLFVVKSKEGKLEAGTVFFLTENVAHCQYIGTSAIGRSSGALNLLFTELIDNKLKYKRYFDFGIVNENDGRLINQGMLAWKERMGGRTISHDFYQIDTSNYKLLLLD